MSTHTSARTASNARSMTITLLGNVASPMAAFLSAPLLARALGADGRGEAAAATAPLLLLTVVAALGLPEAVTYYVARHPAVRRRIIGTAVAAVILSGVVSNAAVWALRAPLAGGDDALATLILVGTSVLVPSLIVGVLRGYAAGEDMWGRVACEKAVNSFTRLAVVAVLFTFDSLTTFTATVALASTTVVGGLVYLLPRPKTLPRAADAGAPPSGLDVLGFGLRMWGGTLTGVLLSRLSQVLLVPLASPSELGLYIVAVQVAEVVLVFNSAMRDVTMARQSGTFSGPLLAQTTRISNFVTLSSSVTVAAVAPWAVPLIFGREFSESVMIIWVLLLGSVLGNAGSVAGAGLVALGRPGLRSWSLGIALLVNFSTLIVLAPVMGGLGAAVATAMGSFVAGTLNVIWVTARAGLRRREFMLFRARDVRVVADSFGRLTKGARR